MTGRYRELLDLLELPRYPSWHCRRYGVEAILAMGRKAEAVQYAEASQGLNLPDSVIDQACEEILISSGLHEEAYRRFGLSAAVGNSYIARFRSIAKRYPHEGQVADSVRPRRHNSRRIGKVVCSGQGTRTL